MKIALLAMIGAVLIQHLGLASAISKVIGKVASCPICFTFWSCLVCLLYMDYDIIIAVVLSILMAYASNWFVLLLIQLQTLYDRFYGEESNEGATDSKTTTNNENETDT